jgi:dTDP-4-dehydrorhamnose reductase
MIRWLVIGAGGRLGRDLVEMLAADPEAWVVSANRTTLDLTDPAAVSAAVSGYDVVVNTAAWTDVDAAEQREIDAHRVNGDAVAMLASACSRSGARLLQISTDYVFGAQPPTGDGFAENARPGPVNAYGRSKLAGERAVRLLLPDTGYVVRTAWLYTDRGSGFPIAMLRMAAAQPTVDVVDDQFGQPTWTAAVAAKVWELGRAAVHGRAQPGVYHATATGRTTWCGFAREIFQRSGLDPARVRAVRSTDRAPRPARRPEDTALTHGAWAAAGIAAPDDWRTQIRSALATPALTALRRRALRASHG